MSSLPQVIFEPNRIGLLVELARCGGRMRSPDLQAVLGMNSPMALWHHKKKLVRAGLVSHVGPTISLTDDGRQALADLSATIDHAINGADAQK
jgi:hypothetical protein